MEDYQNNDGAILCLVNQEEIHLSVDTIHQIIEVATKNDEWLQDFTKEVRLIIFIRENTERISQFRSNFVSI